MRLALHKRSSCAQARQTPHGKRPNVVFWPTVALRPNIKCGDDAERTLIQSNLRLVVNITKKYQCFRLPLLRSHPRGEPRPHPRSREVRLAERLQVLHVRDLVDPPSGLARCCELSEDNPTSGSRRRRAECSQGGTDAPCKRSSVVERRGASSRWNWASRSRKVEEILQVRTQPLSLFGATRQMTAIPSWVTSSRTSMRPRHSTRRRVASSRARSTGSLPPSTSGSDEILQLALWFRIEKSREHSKRSASFQFVPREDPPNRGSCDVEAASPLE